MSKAIDMHCDTLSYLYKKNELDLYNTNSMVDIKRLIDNNYYAQAFAVFVHLNDKAYFEALKIIDFFKNEMNKNEEYISQVYKPSDLMNNINNNKLSAILTIEDLGIIDNDLLKINELYNLGVRMMGLIWNYENSIGSPQVLNIDKGLTVFGIKVVEKLNDLGIIIDVSHLSNQGVLDVLKYSNKPIVASHSNAYKVCNNKRNLNDDLIKKINENRGIIGINFYSDFLSNEKQYASIDDVILHIKYIYNLVGIDVIALGSDFDGISPNPFIKDCSFMSVLKIRLKEEGFSDIQIDKIMYLNFLRVFKDNIK